MAPGIASDSQADAGNPSTVQELVRQLSRFGSLPAIIGVGPEVESVTFAELASRAQTIAKELCAIGVGVGEPVAIIAPTSLDSTAACLGILAAGAAAAPFDVQQNESERARLISSLGCRFQFSSDSGEAQGGGASWRIEGCASLVLHSLSGMPAPASSTAPPVAGPEDLALVVHTSGTTGTPKAVLLNHTNIVTNILGLTASGVANTSERALMPLPLHHVYPVVVGILTPLSAGASIVLPSGISGPELARALKVGGPTVLVAVPRLYDSMLDAILAKAKARGGLTAAIFRRLLNLSVSLARRGRRGFGRVAFKSLRRTLSPTLYRMVSGGAALRETTELTLTALGYEVLKGYGLSETSPILAFTPPGRTPLGSVGWPVLGTTLRIAQPDLSGAGAIEATGPNVFSGYGNDPAATAAAFTPDGWFRTGDRGRFGADGNLYIMGRASETLVLPGGEKLDPETVEARYAGAPAIAEIAVLAQGGKLAGYAVPSPAAEAAGDPDAAEAAVRAALMAAAADLPSYMQLSGFAIAPAPLPRTQAGKLQRHLLPPLYQEARSRAEARAAGRPDSAANQELLANPNAARVWTWLQTRFPGKRLSLEMNPRLDLGIDSLGWVTVTMELEQALGIALDETAVSQIVTLRDLVAAASKGVPLPPPEAQPAVIAKPGIFARAAWHALHAANRLLMRAMFKLRVEGAENLPPHGPYLICPNHLSNMDPAAVGAALPWRILRQVHWAGAAEILFVSGWSRAFSRLMRVLAVEPGVRSTFSQSTAVLQTGHILVWFPEAWRSKDGSLQPFLPGIGAVLRKTPLPVVPVYINGTFEAWPRQRRFPRPHAVTIRFGKPVSPDQWANLGADGEAEERIASSIKEAVAALSGRQ